MLAEIPDVFGRPDRDEFAHPEGLQPIDLARRLATETIAGNVEDQPFRRGRAPGGGNGIDGITGRRRQHEFARIDAVGPGPASLETVDRSLDPRFVAAERADAA